MTVAAVAVGLMVTASAGAGSVAVTQTVTDQWASGYQAALTVRNDSGAALKSWRLEFDLPHRVTSMWDAVLVSQVNNHVVVDAPAWQRDIASGSTASLGYVAALTGARREPTNCKINGLACSFGGSTPTSSSSSSSSSSTSTSTSVVVSGGASVRLAYKTTDQWESGYNAQIDITNTGASTINGWTLSFKLPGSTVTQMWNATYTRAADGTYTARNETWNGSLASNQSANVGFGAGGIPSPPTNCIFNGVACSFVGGGGTTTTTSSTTSSTSTTSTTIGGSGGGGTGRLAFAPYVDATLWPTFDTPSFARSTGVKSYTLGFIVNGQGTCRATWGTYYNLGDNWMADQVAALRGMGGDVVASFGGAANQELAQVCTSVDALAAQYQAVIDKYGLTNVDFDIEGAAVAEPASVDRRSKAIAKVQQQARAAGRQLRVSLTLPVMPTGLTADGVNVVRSARDNGVDVSVVNVMAMDYGLGGTPQMGNHAVQAATSTRDQVRSLYPTRTDAQLWATVGVTPMIGQNDIRGEVFSTADARQLTDFAKANHLGRVAMWSANRDSQCAGGVKTTADNLCSGVLQSPAEFSTTFNQFTG